MSELANTPGEGESSTPELANSANPDVIETPEVVEGADPSQPPVDDTEEIEYEGAKHKIPKALKGAFLFQADYTRKTQEVAQQRTELQERSRTLQQQAETQQAFIKEIAKVEALNDAIAQYENLNWNELRRQDAATTDQLWFQYQQTMVARGKAVAELQQKQTERSQTAAQEAKRLSEESEAALQREIPGWSIDTRGKVTEFLSREFGVSPREAETVTNPVLWKLAHRAYLGDQAIKQAAKAAAAAKTAAAAEGVKPVPQVGSNARSTAIDLGSPASDRLDADEWVRRRRKQTRS